MHFVSEPVGAFFCTKLCRNEMFAAVCCIFRHRGRQTLSGSCPTRSYSGREPQHIAAWINLVEETVTVATGCDVGQTREPVFSTAVVQPRPWFAASTSTVGSHAGGHWFVVPWQGLQLGLHDLGLFKIIFPERV